MCEVALGSSSSTVGMENGKLFLSWSRKPEPWREQTYAGGEGSPRLGLQHQTRCHCESSERRISRFPKKFDFYHALSLLELKLRLQPIKT